jgi:hypothetical protein
VSNLVVQTAPITEFIKEVLYKDSDDSSMLMTGSTITNGGPDVQHAAVKSQKVGASGSSDIGNASSIDFYPIPLPIPNGDCNYRSSNHNYHSTAALLPISLNEGKYTNNLLGFGSSSMTNYQSHQQQQQQQLGELPARRPKGATSKRVAATPTATPPSSSSSSSSAVAAAVSSGVGVSINASAGTATGNNSVSAPTVTVVRNGKPRPAYLAECSSSSSEDEEEDDDD